jgi:competence protein ComGC
MRANQNGFSVYKILSILFFILLIFILTLPQMFDLNKQKKTDDCIKNMKKITEAVQSYYADRGPNPNLTMENLLSSKYLENNPECPEENIGDKYKIKIDPVNNTVEVICPNAAKHPDHKLPPTPIN